MNNIHSLGPETRIKKNSKQLIANVTNSAIHPNQQMNNKMNQLCGYKTGAYSQVNNQNLQNKMKYQQFTAGQLSEKYADKSKEKEKLLNAESQLLADTSRMRQQTDRYHTDRLNTEEIIPSFREKYQIYELLQEIAEHRRVIDMKNKEIFYLSNQIVSVKDEFTQKIIQLQSIISENKRELTQLRYSGLKNKRLQSQKGDRALDEFKKNYQLQIFTLKDTHEQLIKKNQQQHKKQIENMEQKFGSILKLQKRQKNAAEQLFNQKAQNYQALIKQLQLDIAGLRKEKEQLYSENNKQQIALDGLKEQLKIFSDRASHNEKDMKIQIQNLKSQLITLQNTNTQLQKNAKKDNQQYQKQLQQLCQTSQLYKQQIQKLKTLLISKDKQISKFIDQNNRNKIQKYRKNEERHLDPVRICNHEGLIQQLERNIQIKNKENQELREQLKEWGKYIGFERSCQDRTSDLLNASSEALQTQQHFSNSLKKKLNKINR